MTSFFQQPPFSTEITERSERLHVQFAATSKQFAEHAELLRQTKASSKNLNEIISTLQNVIIPQNSPSSSTTGALLHWMTEKKTETTADGVKPDIPRSEQTSSSKGFSNNS